ncbi:hypothetical protein [Streptomyces sp. T028]|uniref:hypothetical protein n=1 Tax=Streptomyces sp. T028 TaxID=3394379 RepID=UPI003A880DF9
MSPTRSVRAVDRQPVAGGLSVTRLREWIAQGTDALAALTGVGGILVLLAYVIGGWQITAASTAVTGSSFSWLRPDSWATVMLHTGNLALQMLGLAIALYIAYGIAGRVALIPALVGGVTAMSMNTGYLGGLAAGVLAGITTHALQRITVSDKWRTLFAAAVPLLSTLVGVAFFSGLVEPGLAHLNS